MRTVLITGYKGIIGSVLERGLKDRYQIRGVDLPEDITHYEVLRPHMVGVDTVIHLAHTLAAADTQVKRRMRIYPQNVQIDVNVFTAVVQTNVKRLIMASSVHADDHRGLPTLEPLAIPGSCYPATPYGAYKLIGEEVGKALSKQFDFEFIGVRFGGVTPDDHVKTGKGQTATWLSHDDLVEAVAACMKGQPTPRRATIFYAVSNNADRIHDTANPFGWEPKDNSADRSPS
jgi:nucleoside-diphosphate-sugar epimerase